MKTLKLKPGKYGYARKPILHLNLKGKPFLWIGNCEEFEDPLCYATFSGPRSMEKFAKAILEALKKKKVTKKSISALNRKHKRITRGSIENTIDGFKKSLANEQILKQRKVR